MIFLRVDHFPVITHDDFESCSLLTHTANGATDGLRDPIKSVSKHPSAYKCQVH